MNLDAFDDVSGALQAIADQGYSPIELGGHSARVRCANFSHNIIGTALAPTSVIALAPILERRITLIAIHYRLQFAGVDGDFVWVVRDVKGNELLTTTAEIATPNGTVSGTSVLSSNLEDTGANPPLLFCARVVNALPAGANTRISGSLLYSIAS